MAEELSPEQSIINKTLLLCLLREAERHGPLYGRLKIQKLAFLITYNLFQKRCKAFDMTFFRYELGPMSKHVYRAEADLEAVKKATFTRVYAEGRNLADAIWEEVLNDERNEPVASEIRRIARRHGSWTGTDLKEHVYKLKVRAIDWPGEMELEKFPKGVEFTRPLTVSEAQSRIHVSQGWLETLALELDPQNRERLDKALARR